MALRLRRGTDAERQLITPLEGELIYTTDTKILFIGDGVTQGGLQVTGVFPESIDDLTDVDISNIAPTVGQVLIWNGEQFVPADIIGPDGQINADIIADDSTLLVDSETQAFQGISFVGQNFIGGTFTGSFIGDGSQLTNLPITPDILEGGNYQLNITGEDSQIIVDTATNTFTGNFVGDGSRLTNLNIGQNSIFDLNDVFTFTPPDFNDILTFDGFNFKPQKIKFIEGQDSSLMLDTTTNTFFGNFVGDGSGLTNIGLDDISIFDLNNVIAVTPPDFNDILTFDGVNFKPQKIQTIEGQDSSIMLDTATNSFFGNFIGDGNQLTNLNLNDYSIFELNDIFAIPNFTPDTGDLLIYDGVNFTAQKIQTIEGQDSSIMLDTATNTFTGNFVGDGSRLTNLDLNDYSIFDLEDVLTFTPPDRNDLLIYDGFNFRPQKIQTIEGQDSSIMLDTATNTFTGNFVGDGSGLTNLPITPDILEGGNYQLNITGEDSQIIVNTATNSFFGNFDGSLTGSVFSQFSTEIINGDSGFVTGNVENQSVSTDEFEAITTIPGLTSFVSNFSFEDDPDHQGAFEQISNPALTVGNIHDNNGIANGISIVRARGSREEIESVVAGDPLGTILFSGYTSSDKFETAGSIQFSAEGTVSTDIVPGKLEVFLNDDSGTGINTPAFSVNSKKDFEFGGTAVLKNYPDITTRDSEIITPTSGMMIFVLDSDGAGTPKFQGYDGTSWVNLN